MKKTILIFLLLAAAGAFLAASGSKEKAQPENPGRPVKVAVLNGPSGVGLIQLMENPPLEDRNITVETLAVGAPKVLLGQLIKEEWDFAALPANMAAILHNKGVPYKLAAVTGLGNLFLVAPKASGSMTLKELEDLTVHIPGKNTTPDLIMQLLSDTNNLKLDLDYSFSPSDLAKALIGGVVEVAVLPEPLATMAVTKNPDLHFAADLQLLWEETYPESDIFPITVMVVNTAFEEANPVLTDEIMMAMEDSINWVKENPADASVLIGEHGFLLPQPVVEKAIPNSNYAFLTGREAMESAEPYFSEVFRINPSALGGSLPDETLYLK